MTRSASVSFDIPPAITVPPANQTVGAGSNATFKVTATGSAPLCYQWFCNNLPIFGATSNVLVLTNVSLALNQNLYSVTVQNVVGATNSGAILTVGDTVRPVVTNLNLTAGQSVSNGTFTVTGTASDVSGVASVWYQLGSGPWTLATTTNHWANWSALLTLQPGTNTLLIYAVDNNGHDFVYVADYQNNLIRKITPAGVTSTLAGDTNSLSSGYADGTGSTALFFNPTGTAVDGAGNIYVADYQNNLIRKITPAGVTTTLAGDTNDLILSNPNGGFADGSGGAAKFNLPSSVAVDGSGDVYVTDSGNNLIRKITPDGTVTTLAGDTNAFTAGFADGNGAAAWFNSPQAVAVDVFGNVYVADSGNNLIRKITPDGAVTTLAGDTNALSSGYADGIGNAALFNQPYGIAVDGSANVYVGDSGNNLIREITPAGVVTTLAGDTYDLTTGYFYNGGYLDGAAAVAQFYSPSGVAVDVLGNVFVADFGNNLVRKITSAGSVTTLAGDTVDLLSYLNNNGHSDGTGGTATFNGPAGVAVDGSGGNLSLTNSINIVYVVSAALKVSTNGVGSLNPNDNNALLQVGKNYSITATAVTGSGFMFTNWTGGTSLPLTFLTNGATVQFLMVSNLMLQANFVDTNRPALAITNVTAGLQVSNANFVVRGWATDNVAVASVYFQLNTTGWSNATSYNGTNWTAAVTLVPGTNTVAAYAVDTHGNFSPTNSVAFDYVVSALLTVGTNGVGSLSPNDNNALLQVGKNYSITATAVTGAGFMFTNWTGGTTLPLTFLTNGATVQFLMASNLMLQANFVDTNRPALAITNVTAGLQVSNANFVVRGWATDNVAVASVYYQLNTTGWSNATSYNGTNWTAAVTLVPGTNTIAAYAVDTNGNISPTNSLAFDYVVSALLTVSTNGVGSLSPNYNNNLLRVSNSYAITATPVTGSGFMFTNWTAGTTLPLTFLTNGATVQFLMVSNLMLQANFVDTNRPTITITAPPQGQHMSNALATVVGTASDNWRVTGVWYQLNSNVWNLVTATTNNYTNWTQTVTLLSGTNIFKAYALDPAGNYSITNSLSVVSSNTFRLQFALTNAPATSGGLSFDLLISPGLNGQIQFSTNLQNWSTLTNFVGTSNSITIFDPAITNSNRKFYRAVIP